MSGPRQVVYETVLTVFIKIDQMSRNTPFPNSHRIYHEEISNFKGKKYIKICLESVNTKQCHI